MKKYEFKGETYIFNNGKWLTSLYTSAPVGILSELNKLIEDDFDIEGKSVEELISAAKQAKNSDNNQLAQKLLLAAMETATKDEIRRILPIVTSNYRALGVPRKAISYADEYLDICGKEIGSPALYTSLGAAYADLEDYVFARKMADKAYAMTNGKGGPELSGLYGRIKKEVGEE